MQGFIVGDHTADIRADFQRDMSQVRLKAVVIAIVTVTMSRQAYQDGNLQAARAQAGSP